MLMRPLSTASVVCLALALGGCAVGPDFVRPQAPDTQVYAASGVHTQTTSADTEGGASQVFKPGADVPASWWLLYHSQPLNDLIEKALANNPDLAAAKAALRVAQETAAAGGGALYPQIDGSLGTRRAKTSGPDAGYPLKELPSFSVYSASVSVGYSLDIFGGVRRSIEALDAKTDVQRFETEAAKASLAANVTTTAVAEASLKAQIGATKEIIDSERKQLDLLNKQFDVGAVGKVAVLAQAATLAKTEATLPPLQKSLEETRTSLRVLAGELPSTDIGASFDLNSLHLPEELPVSLPSQLVAQRPDIKAAEAALHAAYASVGVATANMLPQVTLTGSYGVDALQMAQMFSPGAALWSLGAGLTQPLFHGGELLHKKRAAEAGLEQAQALYRSAVLSGFKDVANALNALQADAETLKAALAAERAAKNSLDLSREQFQAGAISYLSLLTAEETYEQTRITLVQARAQRYADTAALFLALGGGWWQQEAAQPSVNALNHPSVVGDK